ncbi:MAG: hypothetical protein K6F53_10895 [Lachnospiraceae bacterium]|nr:hypothetical protein [Lachnospiraceae bacterium]
MRKRKDTPELEIIDLNENNAARNDFPEDVFMEDTTEEVREEAEAAPKRKRKRRRRDYRPLYIVGAVAAVILLFVFLILPRIRNGSPEEEIPDLSGPIGNQAEGTGNVQDQGNTGEKPERPKNDHLGSAVIDHILKAADSVEAAYEKRPPTVALTEDNRADFVKIKNCVIDSETGQIRVDLASEGIPRSDDKYYYLFELDAYENGIGEEDEYVTRIYKDDSASLSLPLNVNSTITRLYRKYGVAVREKDRYSLISIPKFITNPEALAKHGGAFQEAASKKGILVDYRKINSGQLEDLGVRQAAINFHLGTMVGPSTNAFFPTIHYNYNGKTYSFNYAVIAGFDNTIRDLTNKGITVTAILLNPYSSANISLIHPGARSSGACPYYMFNAADDDGIEILAAAGSFLADRYSGGGYGRISNWVIANEINARKEWNFYPYTDVDTYSAVYADGFRILYNAIRSTCSGTRLYISLDQQWNRNMKNNPDYDGQDVLDSFNAYIAKHGNIDWGLAFHPYNVPLTSCRTWESTKTVNHTSSTPMISMQNIEVLINYMKQQEYLTDSGDVRSIMITELGYTSSGKGSQELQAAAIAYAYYKVEHYADIDGLLLNRQTDDSTEIAQGLSTGVTTLGGAHKLSYDVFKYMDTDRMEEATSALKPIIGISNWNEIMR